MPQPARPAVTLIPTPPTIAWAKQLAASRYGTDPRIIVSLLWTGECVETLSEGSAGRWQLMKTGEVRSIAADPGAFGRRVFMAPDQLAALHVRHPVLLDGPGGSHSATYRFARDGEFVPPLSFPVGDVE